MSTHWQLDCTGGSGSSASFVTEVNVYVDGTLVATRTHTPVEGDSAPWTFTVPLSLDGTHTVKITDVDASGPREYLVQTTTMECDVPATTLPATTTPPVPASVTAVIVPTTAAAGTTVTVVVPTIETTTTSPTTTATVLAETISAAPATLPATGTATGPLVDAGLGFLLAGVVAVFAARRRLHQPG